MSTPAPPAPSLTPPAPPAYSIYRACSLGTSLFEALKQMKADEELDDSHISHALLQFDAAINAALAERVTNAVTIAVSAQPYHTAARLPSDFSPDAAPPSLSVCSGLAGRVSTLR